MLSAWYRPGEGLRVLERPDPPEPGPGEVLLAPAFTGVCGTDLHLVHGAMDARVGSGVVIGHEASATVVATGPGVASPAVGQAVVVRPTRSDGTCPACRRGLEHLCADLVLLGIDADGAMAQRWLVPADLLVPLPDGVSLEAGALVEPTAVAVHDVERAAVAADERVLVVGAGPVGLLVALVARHRGADVLLVELAEHRRAGAAALGLTVLDPGRHDVLGEVDRWTGGAGADASFEVSGSAAGADTALAALGVRGRLCLVGIHTAARSVDYRRVFERELVLVGARLYQRADVEEALRLVAAGVAPAEQLVTHVVPLARAERAVELLGSGTPVTKLLVDCRGG